MRKMPITATVSVYVFSSVKIAPGAVVCVESEIKGDVTIGKRK